MPETPETNGGPTRGSLEGWTPRPSISRALRVASAVVPVFLSVGFALVLINVLPPPGSPGQTAGWWATLGLSVIAFAMASERLFRRLLPVANVFEMSLTFPDEAPSQFRAALRTNSVRNLQRELAEGRLDQERTPTESAELLIEMANALSHHDRATRGHTERVRAYSQIIGQQMGLPKGDLDRLRWAALIHDVGKLRVPPEILNSPDAPTEKQWEILAQHPAHGAELVEPLAEWLGDYARAAGEHHERWDGKGYPNGLEGKEIALAARIVSVADAFDVMTSVRSYKAAAGFEEAKAELARNAGTQFDPDVVRAFVGAPIPRSRFAGFAGLIAQVPLLGSAWPNSGTTVTSVAAAVVAALTLTPGGFSPELIAYGVEDLTVAEDSELSFAVAPAPLPDTVRIISVEGPATATWDGSEITIEGEPNASGLVTVTYEACWDDECQTRSTSVTLLPVNDVPVVVVDTVTASEPGTVVLSPLENDSDADNDELSLDSAEVVSGRASVEVDGPDLVVTPDDDEPQTIDLAYVVSDGAGATETGTAQVIVPDFNGSPVTVADEATVEAGGSVTIDVLANDTDPDGDELTIESVGSSDAGNAGIVDGQVRFTAALITATAEVAYEVSDGTEISAGVLTVEVVPPAPTPQPDTASTREDTAVTFNVTDNDTAVASEIDPATVRIVGATLGSATALADGQIRFVPDPDVYGIGSVQYEVCNLSGLCATAEAEVGIERVNDAPTFTAGSNVLARTGEVFSRPWASNISVGEDNEPNQSVRFIVTADQPGLFATPPSIDADGTLRFNAGATTGSSQVTVVASDGVDNSAAVTFEIVIS